LKFTIDRESLLSTIQLVSGVVESRQTIPVLSNLLCVLDDDGLYFTGTDQEVALSAGTTSVVTNVSGEITIPSKKLLDICRSQGTAAEITFKLEGGRLNISSGRFNSSLAILPSETFPSLEMGDTDLSLCIEADRLASLLEATSFAMAQQDVRYFFNGMLLEMEENTLRAVATNGQRLATSIVNVSIVDKPVVDIPTDGLSKKQFIVPGKSINELARMVKKIGKEKVEMRFNYNRLQVSCGLMQLTTKLVDAQYPEYQKVMATGGDKTVTLDRLELKEALSRIAILSNEVYRNVKLSLTSGVMTLSANNPLKEEAEETIEIDYNGEEMEIGFNVVYLIDVLKALTGDKVDIILKNSSSAMLISSPDNNGSEFVVSPMML